MTDIKAVPPDAQASVSPSQADLTPRDNAGRREDAVLCERCGRAEMYRMHAVWRCPVCGFKTDCCGW